MIRKLGPLGLASAVALGACAQTIYVRRDITKATMEADEKACAAEIGKKKPEAAPAKDVKTDGETTVPTRDEGKTERRTKETSALPDLRVPRAEGQTAALGLIIIFTTAATRAAATTAIAYGQARAQFIKECMHRKGYVSHQLT